MNARVVGEMFVKVRDRDAQGWCAGCINGRVGLYPDNYVEIISQWLSHPATSLI